MQRSSAEPSSELRPITVPVAATALLCAVLWGGTAVAIRFTQDALPPVLTAALRFGLSCLFMAVWCWWQQQPLCVRGRQWRPVLIVGVMLFAQISLFHWGLTLTNAAHASILIGSHPVMIAILAHFALHGDRLNVNKVIGMSVAMSGVVLVVSSAPGASASTEGDPSTLFGDAVIVISSMILASKTVVTKAVLRGIAPATLILWSNLVGTLLMFAYAFSMEDVSHIEWTMPAFLALLYQGFIVAGFCFGMWTMLLRHHRASELGVFAFAQPISGLFIAAGLRGDPLTSALLIGAVAVGLGIVLVTRGAAKAAEAET